MHMDVAGALIKIDIIDSCRAAGRMECKHEQRQSPERSFAELRSVGVQKIWWFG